MMRSTWAKLKDIVFKGETIGWVGRSVKQYQDTLQKTDPTLAKKLEKLHYARLNGSPHPTSATGDPYHASVALRKKEDFKGSGLSLHVYPDGTVRPSRSDFPSLMTTPAAPHELGEDACWLDPDFVEDWKEEVEGSRATYHDSIKDKGKDKGKAKGKGKLSNHQKPSGRHGSSSRSKGKGRVAEPSGYEVDPGTGTLYRYTEDGLVIYLDSQSQREYYVREDGQTEWS